MKPLVILALALSALTYSGSLYISIRPHAFARPPQLVPPSILWGVAAAESSLQHDAISPDGRDRGIFQLRRDYDAERGVVDPFDPVESTRHASRILAENFAQLKTWRRAIAAYRQGVRGVRENGVDQWYVDRVLGVNP